jgi:hypothetical protein
MIGARPEAVPGSRWARSLSTASTPSSSSGVMKGETRRPRSTISPTLFLGLDGSRLAQYRGLAVPQIRARPVKAPVSTRGTADAVVGDELGAPREVVPAQAQAIGGACHPAVVVLLAHRPTTFLDAGARRSGHDPGRVAPSESYDDDRAGVGPPDAIEARAIPDRDDHAA